jgi:cell division protease FtsH
VSAETQAVIDEEVHRLVADAHDEVVELLRANRDKLDGLAHALLEHETLDQSDAYAAAGVDQTSGDGRGAELAPAARSSIP